MLIIGLSGTNGAGKDSIGEMLEQRHGFIFISGSDMLREEARRRGLPVERETLRMISSEWRRERGLGAIVDKAAEIFKKGEYTGLAVASIRNPGEADRIHELGGQMIWVDADPKVRYNRVFSRQRTAEDKKTYQEFLTEQETEMKPTGDETSLNISGVKDRCDIFIENNGNDIEKFKSSVEEQLAEYL